MTLSCTGLICLAVFALQFFLCRSLNEEVFFSPYLRSFRHYSKAIGAFMTNSPIKYFDIIVEADDKNVELLSVVERFLTRMPKNTSFTHTLSVNTPTDGNNLQNIIFVDGYSSFLKLYPNLEKQGVKEMGSYIIVLVCKPVPDWFQIMWNILKKMYQKNVVDVYVITQSSKDILDFYTFYPYSQDHCEKVVLIRVNRFENDTLEKHLELPLKKCNNFHGCTMNVFAWMVKPFVVFGEEATLQSTTVNFTGFEGELVKAVARKLNFTIHLQTDFGYNWGNVDGDNYTGPYGLLQNRSIDLLIGFIVYSSDRTKYFPFSNSHYMSKYVAIVRRQNAADKVFSWLWEPFQKEIWMLILLTSTLMIVCITIFVSQEHRTLYFLFYFGELIGVPMQNPFPRTKRYVIYIVASVCCFILRSIYTGNIYSQFSNERYIKPPETISDLLDQNYTILATRPFFEPNSGRTVPRGVPIGSNGDVMFEMLEKSAVGSKTAALVSYAKLIHYGTKINPQMPFEQIREPLKMISFCGYFKKGSCLTKPFSDVVESLLNAGIMTKWVSEFDVDTGAYNNFYRNFMKFKEPIPLSLRKFTFVFILWGSGLFIAFLVFIFEIRNESYKSLCGNTSKTGRFSHNLKENTNQKSIMK